MVDFKQNRCHLTDTHFHYTPRTSRFQPLFYLKRKSLELYEHILMTSIYFFFNTG